MTGSRADGDDLLQDALIKALQAFPKLRDVKRFKPWMLTILRNTHRSNLRRNWLRNWLPLEKADRFAVEDGLALEEKELVRLALQAVPVKQREAIVLFEVLGMKVEEVAKIQNVSLSAVKSRLSRGRSKLREEYHALNRTEKDHAKIIARTI
jgi:RNA polymerase sigma-70 factor (ECF subfamily)